MKYVQVRSYRRRIGKRQSSGGCFEILLLVPLVLIGVLWGMLFIARYEPVLFIFLLCIIVPVIALIIKKRKERSASKLLSEQSLPTQTIFIRDTIRDTRYIPDDLRRAVLDRDHYCCCVCGSQSYLEMDHIIPLSKGGATSYDNLQVLCRRCNATKGNR